MLVLKKNSRSVNFHTSVSSGQFPLFGVFCLVVVVVFVLWLKRKERIRSCGTVEDDLMATEELQLDHGGVLLSASLLNDWIG